MEVVRLSSTTYRPDLLIEDYSSMVWNERFATPGQFEMQTEDVAKIRYLLPIGSYISLRDSDVLMQVENHSLSRAEDAPPVLTVSGRTFETFIENRALLAAVYNTPWKVLQPYTPTEMVAMLLWNHMVNTTGEDPTRAAYVIDSRTAVPNVVVTDSTTLVDSQIEWWLETGNVFKALSEFLALDSLGVRNFRPNNKFGDVVTFDTSRTASRGLITKTPSGPISQVRLDVYHGLDKTRHQTVRPPVILHYSAGHLDTLDYLLSNQNYSNMATVVSSIGTVTVWPNTTPPPDTTVSGVQRRTLLVDGGDMGDLDYATFAASLIQKGRVELRKHLLAAVFEGRISPQGPYHYKADYDLGDVITLIGEDGFEASMVISEYIRTQGAEGELSYPGLSPATWLQDEGTRRFII